MMDVIIVGAGPTGLTLGRALARRRHRVVAIERDPGPAPDGSWRRTGVMQFDQAHGFRPQVRDLLLAEWPEAWRAWQDLGAETFPIPARGASPPSIGVRSRRSIYERALRQAATAVDGLTVAPGTVHGFVDDGGRVVGVIADGSIHRADLVIDASGRLSRFAPPAAIGGDTGMAYVSRTFRRARGAPPGPMAGPVSWVGMFVGYDSYVFPHEHGHISVVLIRPTADAAFGIVRHLDAFEAACRAIPGLAAWTDPQVTTPTSGILIEPMARAVYETGWRPPTTDGPTRDELLALARRASTESRGTATRTAGALQRRRLRPSAPPRLDTPTTTNATST